MKRILLLIILTCGFVFVSAQTPQERYNALKQQAQQKYDNAKQKAVSDYEAFRKRANAEYAAAMERAWSKVNVQPAEEKPKEPEPPIPQEPPIPEEELTTNPLPQADVVTPPLPAPPAIPAPPVREPEPAFPTMSFAIYGTNCNIHTPVDGLRFKLSSVDEKGAAAAWKNFSQEKYDGMLHDCLSQRDAMHLGDWGYVKLLQSATEKLLGKGSNESVLLQMYLLAQSGYSARIAKANDHLILLVPFKQKIVGYTYTILDDANYYMLTKEKFKSIEVFNVAFPREQIASLSISQLPLLKGKQLPKRTFSGERFGTMKADIGVNQSLIDFMNEFPQFDATWDVYANAGLSDVVKTDLYPALRNQIEGKSKQKAVFMILDFVQYAFEYAKDNDQFGYERPLFGDESFYYPYNDCEDRAILFSILVRDLVGLDVVLVHWPGYLGAAVAFDEDVEGDYFTLDGRRYTVCDPTYVGSKIGMTMKSCKNAPATLIKVK